ncbi:MFS transporter [Pseudonocardia abyssalis]|uniref:MFS transporter n=1 Tax=Pseudonocardia abyssalis TaxID=2792008 RepID=A0ABS6UW28_9PSEU|nr:MFS transporter [Pseudonocardia abyssalis]MBW0115877.1 MFS transporter [Pseudonocardia abyssalis]MBW0136452.1 MFS transporter [Pseudonocardia abyssalis]
MSTVVRPTAVRPWVVLLGLLALAVNLRASLAGYPPLLESVRAELDASAGVAGLVQAGAVLMMGAGSFAGPVVGARFGRERALGGAVGLVALGGLLRGVPELGPSTALWSLIGGSLVVGAGIGLAGVLLSGVVKEHLAERAGLATGGYVVSMMVGATVASAVAVPLSVALGGWSFSLAVWAVPAVFAVALWTPIARRVPVPERTGHRTLLPWRDPFTRLSACYQTGTSVMFYGWLTWLAPYYEGQGWSPTQAGLLLAVWSVTQIPAALLAPAFAERRRRWRFWAMLTLACGVAGTVGAAVLPMPPLLGPWIWVVLMGVGVGAGFPLGLTVIAWRTPDGAASSATTGFALGVGYTAAGLTPLLMGVLLDVTGAYPAAIAVLLAAGALQAFAIVKIGDRPVTG